MRSDRRFIVQLAHHRLNDSELPGIRVQVHRFLILRPPAGTSLQLLHALGILASSDPQSTLIESCRRTPLVDRRGFPLDLACGLLPKPRQDSLRARQHRNEGVFRARELGTRRRIRVLFGPQTRMANIPWSIPPALRHQIKSPPQTYQELVHVSRRSQKA